MKIELDKEDLISLVNGTGPNFDIMDSPMIEPYGYFNDNKGWVWYGHELKELTEESLYGIYKMCKASWEKRELYKGVLQEIKDAIKDGKITEYTGHITKEDFEKWFREK